MKMRYVLFAENSIVESPLGILWCRCANILEKSFKNRTEKKGRLDIFGSI
jgi:hypothetical protein